MWSERMHIAQYIVHVRALSVNNTTYQKKTFDELSLQEYEKANTIFAPQIFLHPLLNF